MRKRSITLNGHRTSISLEHEFWDALDALAAADGRSLADLIAEIDARRANESPPPGLASSLRIYVLERFRKGA
ncbi:MAG: ribbon-helix-helix domain-containing protein [Parvularculaceae bacterium]